LLRKALRQFLGALSPRETTWHPELQQFHEGEPSLTEPSRFRSRPQA
jgi:hypothetical protein